MFNYIIMMPQKHTIDGSGQWRLKIMAFNKYIQIQCVNGIVHFLRYQTKNIHFFYLIKTVC